MDQRTAIFNAEAFNPLENDALLAGIAHWLDREGRERFRHMGLLLPRGQQSLAEGSAPGSWFLASTARRAANEAVLGAQVCAFAPAAVQQ